VTGTEPALFAAIGAGAGRFEVRDGAILARWPRAPGRLHPGLMLHPRKPF
jgi:hypothetical protein